MDIPIELLSYYILSYFNTDEALRILPFLANKEQRKYLSPLQSKYKKILSFMKNSYIKWYKHLCNKKLSKFFIDDHQWLFEIMLTSESLDELLRELQGILAYEFTQYAYIIDDFHYYRKPITITNVSNSKIVMGSVFDNFEYSMQLDNHRIYTPQSIHRIYPVYLPLAIKIRNNQLLAGLLY